MTMGVVRAGAIVVLLMSGTVQSQEPVAELKQTINDVLLPSSKVSGRLLVGIVAHAEQAIPSEEPSLFVFAETNKSGQRICVNVITSDGLYRSGDVEYELPATGSVERIRLPYTKARHFDYLAKQKTDQVAVLARVGGCESRDGHQLIAAFHPPGKLNVVRVAVITGGRDTTLSVRSIEGAWSEPLECRLLTGVATAFDALCTIDPVPEAERFSVKVQSYSALGTPINPPLEFDVVRRTSTAK